MPEPKKRRRLSKLKLNEISIVPEGMNDHARVVLFKAKGRGTCADCPSPDECATGGCGMDAAFAEGVRKAMSGDDDAAEIIAEQARRLDEDAAAEFLTALSSLVPQTAVAKSLAGLAADHPGDSVMTLDEIKAALTAAETKLATLEGEIAKGGAAAAAKDAEIVALKAEIAKLKPGQTEEEFLKGLPEAVRKRFEEQERVNKENAAVLATMVENQETTAIVAKVKGFGTPDPDKAAVVLYRIRKGTAKPEDADALEAILKSAGAIAKAAGSGTTSLRVVGGADAGDGAEPMAVLKGKAAEFKAKEPTLTDEQAFVKAAASDPKLYVEYQKAKGLGILGAIAS